MLQRSFGISVLATLLAGAIGTSLAQAASTDAIDRYVEAEMTRERIPGLALGIYHNGKIIKAKGYGLANIELGVPVNAATIFQSGSVGKQFTATAIMMLVEAGRISLSDSITRFFPGAPAAWRAVTVRQLLSHTSGLSDYTGDEHTKPGGPINYRADYTEDSLVRIIESFAPDFAPGAKWDYSNTNYLLLGAVIRQVTGQFYGDFLKERIFTPLGMTSTRVMSEEDIVMGRSAGYRLVKGEIKNQEWVSPTLNTTADGALYFNVADLAKWDAALYGEQLLKRASLDSMWTVAKLNDGTPNEAGYGFAWGIHAVNGHRVIEHGGSWQGFTTHIARYVNDTFTVVVLTNLDSEHSAPGRIAHAVARLYRPSIAYKPIADRDPRVTALVREYLTKRMQPEPDSSLMTPEFFDLVKGQWSQAVPAYQKRGPAKSVVLVERQANGGPVTYRYLVTYKEEIRVVTATVNADGRLSFIESAAY